MGIAVFILGHSGTGKSTSMRNFKSDELALVNVQSKPLPFKGGFEDIVNSDNYDDVLPFVKKTNKKTIVIDDGQYLMANEFMRRAYEKGYDKFNELGEHFWNLVNVVINELPYDRIVYFLMHVQSDESGNEKVKTIGKMLDEKITLEGMSAIVLQTSVKDSVYKFTTQNSGKNTVKSPLGMFNSYEIDNDLKFVDETIRAYYELETPIENNRTLMSEHDKEVDAGGVSTEAPKVPTRSRRTRAEEKPVEKSEEKPKRRRASEKFKDELNERETEFHENAGDEIKETISEEPKKRERRKRDTEPEQVEKSDDVKSEDTEDEKSTRRRRRRE